MRTEMRLDLVYHMLINSFILILLVNSYTSAQPRENMTLLGYTIGDKKRTYNYSE